MAKLDDQEKSDTWTQIWYGNNGYFAGLDPKRFSDLMEYFYNMLDLERRRVDKDLPEPDMEEIPKPEVGTPDEYEDTVHDPKHYLFGEKSLWIPWAFDAPSGAKRGTYKKGYPTGMVVHWTAGHRNGLTRGNDLMRSTGMHYLICDEDGALAQADPLNRWGYHAGKSSWPGTSGGVNDDFIGLELQAAGHLRVDSSGEMNNYYPWWDKGQHLPKNRIDPHEVVKAHADGNIAKGYYHAYTQLQMTTLRKTICWLHLNNPEVFSISNVVGHDEVSPGRKVDPGGALVDKAGRPMTMSDFRIQLRTDVAEIKNNRPR